MPNANDPNDQVAPHDPEALADQFLTELQQAPPPGQAAPAGTAASVPGGVVDFPDEIRGQLTGLGREGLSLLFGWLISRLGI